MIQLHIITKKPEQVKGILETLINGGLITGAAIFDTTSSYKSDKGEIKTVSSNILIGRTKAMFFNKIEKLLENKYGDNIPAIYGMPIINMDFRHLEKLKKLVKTEKWK